MLNSNVSTSVTQRLETVREVLNIHCVYYQGHRWWSHTGINHVRSVIHVLASATL